VAPLALDDLAPIWADLCLLCHRRSARLLDARASHLLDLLMVNRSASDNDGHGSVGYIPMVMTGYLEQARAAAQRTFIPGTETRSTRI
jgi:histidine ammonia-lyase